jgi:hypothetical protein
VGQGVGELDHELVVEAVLDFWRSRNRGADLMADVWRQGRTLRVVRADPFVTPGGKTLPLQTGEPA